MNKSYVEDTYFFTSSAISVWACVDDTGDNACIVRVWDNVIFLIQLGAFRIQHLQSALVETLCISVRIKHFQSF
jgi:hypothetical protein